MFRFTAHILIHIHTKTPIYVYTVLMVFLLVMENGVDFYYESVVLLLACVKEK